jgi:hypothetical protein
LRLTGECREVLEPVLAYFDLKTPGQVDLKVLRKAALNKVEMRSSIVCLRNVLENVLEYSTL